jgi:phage anti-repressor protein
LDLRSLVKSNALVLIVVSIIAIGFGVRIWAIDYGMPYVSHIEEPFYTRTAWSIGCTATFESSLVQIHTYLQAGAIAASRLLNSGVCAADYPLSMTAVLYGRVINAVLGSLTLLVVFAFGRRLFNAPVGILAAILMALNFLHVRESHHGTPDISGTLMILLTAWSYIRLQGGKVSRGWYVLMGALTALAISTRLTAVLLVLPFYALHLYGWGFFRTRRLLDWLRIALAPHVFYFALAAGCTYLLINPQIWMNLTGFLHYWKDFFTLGQLGGYGRLQVDTLTAPFYYTQALGWGSGILLLILSGVAVLWAIRKHTVADALLLLFAVTYFIVAAISTVYFARYIIPITPFLYILVARFLWEVLQNRKRRLLWVSAAMMILLAQPVDSIVRYSHLQTQPDTRFLAEEWMDANLPSDAQIAAEWNTWFPENKFAVTIVDFHGLSERTLAEYRRDGYDYLISVSYIREAGMILPDEQAHKIAFYHQLDAETELIQEFRPYDGEVMPRFYLDQTLGPITDLHQFTHPGPTIRIYHLLPAPEGASRPTPSLGFRLIGWG